ncbi:unnamed protein product [Bursaphelenchus xylophilus]|uniref:(pine wood nematode) hypothetical protein n=1 Tax=Bursaphelenchus xylophilus TaxID=6326 RepID=A0A1I7RHZ7_BURXY|nr:unnamed protein product [Bursaphelenchus xylophilus]CAG9115263.1 unnamed protein product [Bursaphelenchus xylophilus]
MATLDERYLDGPNVGYCSSSDEDEPQPSGGPGVPTDPRNAPQTGPKGVLADYRDAKQAEKQKQLLQEKKLLKDAERFTLSGKADESDDEDSLEAIRKRRIEHLKNLNRARIVEIPNKEEFLHVIESTNTVGDAVIHIYRDGLEATQTLNEALLDLAAQTKNTRFYKVRANALDMTKQFSENALPTLQIYSKEHLIGNFVRITDSLTEDFDVRDLKSLIQQHEVPLQFKD